MPRFVNDRRRQTIQNRVRRTLTDCIAESDEDTMARMVISYHLALIFALLAYASYVIAEPPPLIDGFALRLPALSWAGLLAVGVFWHGIAWREGKCYLRRNILIYLCLVTFFLAGALFGRAPVISIVTFAVNVWQIVLAGRLWVGCADGEGND